MKSLLLAVLILPSILVAQSSPPVAAPQFPPNQRRLIRSQAPSDALPDNYQIMLTVTDKDGQPLEISVVVASTQFSATLGEQNLSFSGSFAVEESGSIVVAYVLGWQTAITSNGGNTQYYPSSAQGSVRLTLGEEIQIIRAGPRIAKLSIKKLEPSKPK